MTNPRPVIPMALAHRPVVGGLVGPWVNVRLADGGVDYRSTHHRRWLACWTEGRCQTCGGRLARGDTLVLLGGLNQINPDDGYFDEPPLHPWCARYAMAACPMVAGRQSHYADREHVSAGPRGQQCPDPGCDCGGWTSHVEGGKGGEPAHEWWAVYCRDYAVVVSPEGAVLGGRAVDERRRRLVSSPTTAAGV